MFGLELLDGGEGLQLRGVESGSFCELAVDPVGGVVKGRRRELAAVGFAPAVGLLPHAGDLRRRRRLPPRLIEYRLQLSGCEPAFGLDLLAGGAGSLLAVPLGLLEGAVALREAAAGDDRGH